MNNSLIGVFREIGSLSAGILSFVLLYPNRREPGIDL
jgi:hypothetical protein